MKLRRRLQRNVQSSDSLVARYGTTTFAIVAAPPISQRKP